VEELREDPEKGPRDLHKMLQKKYSIDIPYHRVYRGKYKAMDTIYGKWDDSYDMLPTYEAELLRVVPGSIVELEPKRMKMVICVSAGSLLLSNHALMGFCKVVDLILPWMPHT
jgi:hypothetical protein